MTPRPALALMNETGLELSIVAISGGETMLKKLTMIVTSLTINFAEYFADQG
jgi:hypothetical protein